MPAEARTYGNGSSEMRVSLSTYGSRGDVEPMVGLAVQLRALGAELLARVGAPLVPVGQPARSPVTGATPPSADLPRRAAELVAAQFDTVAAAAEECTASVATGVTRNGVWL
jgi:vancomycin aglycone glucosyltransferase